MKVLLFGATGMVGQGVLRELLRADDVTAVVALVRSAGQIPPHPKLRELVHTDFQDFSAAADAFSGVDACIFCLGVSAGGMSEADYTRLTFDVTVAAARALLQASPKATFIYVSGAGTDSTEKGRAMWARVKGRTENELLRMPFGAVCMFRPGLIRPMNGERSKTPAYRALYTFLGPTLGVFRALAPSLATTTEEVGRAMLTVARRGAPKRVLESADIIALAIDSV